jgi:hypothetical protein
MESIQDILRDHLAAQDMKTVAQDMKITKNMAAQDMKITKIEDMFEQIMAMTSRSVAPAVSQSPQAFPQRNQEEKTRIDYEYQDANFRHHKVARNLAEDTTCADRYVSPDSHSYFKNRFSSLQSVAEESMRENVVVRSIADVNIVKSGISLTYLNINHEDLTFREYTEQLQEQNQLFQDASDVSEANRAKLNIADHTGMNTYNKSPINHTFPTKYNHNTYANNDNNAYDNNAYYLIITHTTRN